MTDLKTALAGAINASQLRLLQDIRYELHLQFESVLNTIWPRRIAKRRMIENSDNIKLHWGSGSKRLDGWLNVDGWGGPAVDYIHDMRKRLPIADERVMLIFTEHVFEHFHAADGLRVLKDFYRILRPGGTVRIIVPDFDVFVARAGESDSNFSGTMWATMDRATAVNDVFYNHFHRSIYNFDMLCNALCLAGFPASNILKSSFRSSKSLELNQDSGGADRLAVSLYIEATK